MKQLKIWPQENRAQQNLVRTSWAILLKIKSKVKRRLIYHDIIYNTTITVAESESDIRITTDTPYLTLTGELSSVYC